MKNDISSSRTMYDVLGAPDRLKHEIRSKGVPAMLAYLWRSILEERNIGLIQFDRLCMQYVRKARLQNSQPRVANYFNRSNIFREMSRPRMTWKVFMKALQLIGIESMSMTVTLEGRGLKTQHVAYANLVNNDGISFEEMEDEKDDDEDDESGPNAMALELRSRGGKRTIHRVKASDDGPTRMEAPAHTLTVPPSDGTGAGAAY